MRKIFLILFLLMPVFVFSQAEYVPVANPVYSFLERMDALHFIKDYDSFQKPKTRKAIAGFLKQVELVNNELNSVDRNILLDLRSEFSLEMFETTYSYQSLIDGEKYDPLSQKEKFLYFNSGNKGNIFINVTADGDFIYNNQAYLSNITGKLLNAGGIIRGTLMNTFGFYIQGSNGFSMGSKWAALQKKELQYNYKFNETPEQTFFDDNEGHLSLDFDWINLKLGRDRLLLGYGENKVLLSDHSPKFDYLQLQFNYGIFSFFSFHGKMLGQSSFAGDTITGGANVLKEKYMAYHRLGFNLTDNLTLGAGEIIIYGDRPMEFSYLNPFNFYKSVEHNNRDRDNAMIFFDLENRSIKGLKLFATLLLDDINYGKIGTGWFGNQTLWDVGFSSYNLYDIIPIDFHFEYTRVEPYVFTHRLPNNSFTNFGYGLSSVLAPNSELFFSKINYRLSHRFEASFSFSYTLHGANYLDEQGNIIKNVGGDISIGHRNGDAEVVKYLDGVKQIFHRTSVDIYYEPYNEIKLLAQAIYANYPQQHDLLRYSDFYVTTIFSIQVKI
ncbi:MAG: capsule assembly Wzi family protein [Ignavibacteria bacterium]|nr:capsule assembly Wzi family protein [Ignavibacteria bacterium]